MSLIHTLKTQLLILVAVSWVMVGFAQEPQEVSFQRILKHTTTRTIEPSKIINLSASRKFLYTVNDKDVWVAQNPGMKAKNVTLHEVSSGRVATLKIPRYILKRSGWPPYNLHVTKSHVILDYYTIVLLYKWTEYGQKAQVVDSAEVRPHKKSELYQGVFSTISDYAIMGKQKDHYIETFHIKNDNWVRLDRSVFRSDLPEYCVFGHNLRYSVRGERTYFSPVGQPYIGIKQGAQIDTFYLFSRKHWVYPDMERINEMRKVKIKSGNEPYFWLNQLRDFRRHHTCIEAIEWLNDSLLFVRMTQPKTATICQEGQSCPRVTTRYEVVNMKQRRTVWYGVFLDTTHTSNTVYDTNNLPCKRLTSSNNGLWNQSTGYEISWGSPINPLGKSSQEYQQAHSTWLSENEPIIEIRTFTIKDEY